MEMKMSTCQGYNENLQLIKKDDTFVVEKSTFAKSYLSNLLKSKNPKEKTMLSLVVSKIVKYDHKDSFEYLLDHGYKIDVLNDQNQTAIHLAIYYNADNILEWGSDLLLSKCTNNLNQTDNNGLSYLHFACMVGKKKTVKKYLENNPDVNARWYHDPQDNRNGFTPLHFAAMNHKTEIVKFLLQRGANINSTDSLGRTPLHLMCSISQKFMWQEGDLISHPDWTSEIKIIKLLVAQGADLNLRDKLGNTPLLSIFKDDKYCREIKDFDDRFVSGKSKNAKNLFKHQKEKFDYLMENGVDLAVVNNNGENVLHRIIGDLKRLRFPIIYENISFEDEFHAKLIDQLLALKCGIDVNEKSSRGESPLVCAISFLSFDIVEVLLNHNADMSDFKFDYRDKNFFNYPAILPNLKSMRNLFSIIKLFESKGFQMTVQDNLAVLQFLIHEDEDCECCDTTNYYVSLFNMYNAFCYGSPQHISHVLNGARTYSEETGLREVMGKFKAIVIHNILKYSKLCKMAKMYYPKDFYRSAKTNNCCSLESYFEKAKNELTRLKSIVVVENVTIYDMLVMDMWKLHGHVKNSNNFDKFFSRAVCYRQILEGRITKCVSLTYLYDSAWYYLRKLTIPLLPDDCCTQIVNYINSSDILNVCLAAVDDDCLNDTFDLKSLRLSRK